MGIKQEAFRKYREGETPKDDTFTIRLNKEEREQFEKDKIQLQQVKDGTAMKQLASIGSLVLHDDLFGGIIHKVLGNVRRNKRTGIVDFE